MANKIFLLPAEPSAATAATPRRPPSSSTATATTTPVQRPTQQRFIFATPVTAPAPHFHQSDPGTSPATTPVPTKRPVFLLPHQHQHQHQHNADPSPPAKPSTPHFLLPNAPSAQTPGALSAASLSTDLITNYNERLKSAERKKNEAEPLLPGGLAERMAVISARERSETVMWLHMNNSDDDERRAQRDLSLAMTVRVTATTTEDPRLPGLQWATCEVLELHDMHEGDGLTLGEVLDIGFKPATEVYGLGGAKMPRVREGDVVRVFDPVTLNLPHRENLTHLCIRYAVD
ncbi:hypothetical protein HDU86_007375 [Geranomyces michiganensis]|nr:hypothetical protein HDU86_007375 [Geranomyces michiganensis]